MFLHNIDGLYSNFAPDEDVITYLQLVERGTRNSKTSTYWINLLEKLHKIDPEALQGVMGNKGT